MDPFNYSDVDKKIGMSLDEIISLNKQKKPNGSRCSNYSYKSNYSHRSSRSYRSYRSNQSHRSHYSNRTHISRHSRISNNSRRHGNHHQLPFYSIQVPSDGANINITGHSPLIPHYVRFNPVQGYNIGGQRPYTRCSYRFIPYNSYFSEAYGHRQNFPRQQFDHPNRSRPYNHFDNRRRNYRNNFRNDMRMEIFNETAATTSHQEPDVQIFDQPVVHNPDMPPLVDTRRLNHNSYNDGINIRNYIHDLGPMNMSLNRRFSNYNHMN